MPKENPTNKDMFGICRGCLNQTTGLKLTTQDCYYAWKEDYCPRCKDFRHIVVALRFRGRLKAFFHQLIKR